MAAVPQSEIDLRWNVVGDYVQPTFNLRSNGYFTTKLGWGIGFGKPGFYDTTLLVV